MPIRYYTFNKSNDKESLGEKSGSISNFLIEKLKSVLFIALLY